MENSLALIKPKLSAEENKIINLVVAGYAEKLKNKGIAPHDLRRTFAKLVHKGGSPIDQIQLSLGHDSDDGKISGRRAGFKRRAVRSFGIADF
ncbi:MAG: site-specific integrase [Acidobacteria bacterium]|jgi:integrase|nr:site-specific integrase [Acidobacteriota bacterium]